jgi:hypothetical protein
MLKSVEVYYSTGNVIECITRNKDRAITEFYTVAKATNLIRYENGCTRWAIPSNM